MLNFKEMKKLQDSATRDRIICPKCGHSILFCKVDKTICKWCNTYVFKDDKTKFKYRLKESINRNK